MRGRSLICIAFAWVCSFCKGKQSFRLSSLIYKWNCHVSTHGSRRGSRHVPASRTFGWIFVSTHGSLAGADRGQNDCRRGRCCFNSRLPCGSRPQSPSHHPTRRRFNSRLPCGSRPWMPGQVCNSVRFNSRLPCGSRQTQLFCRTRCSRFNSRLPCGSRRYFRCPIWIGGLFQLTAPLREPTPYTICPLIRRCFNSRLPCGSRRKDSVLQTNFYGGFNSRLPCGSRLYETITGAATLRVSTHGSLAGADIVCGRRQPCTAVSTHGSLAGADAKRCTRTTGQPTFQLTAPLREPTFPFLRSRIQAGVSTHGSLAGADIFIMGTHFPTALFQLTAPLREPTILASRRRTSTKFQLTAPLREPT